MSLEVFKTIPGYPNYRVSSWGRVQNILTGQFLKPHPTAKGYLRIDLWDGHGNKQHMRIHRLVAVAFVGNPFNKPQINHIDGNKRNNSYTNLEWVTDSENKAKRKELMRMKG